MLFHPLNDFNVTLGVFEKNRFCEKQKKNAYLGGLGYLRSLRMGMRCLLYSFSVVWGPKSSAWGPRSRRVESVKPSLMFSMKLLR